MPPPLTAHDQDVVVVGGGVIGLSIAWEMSLRNKNVTVLERKLLIANRSDQFSKPSLATSWTAAGILPPANFQRATDPLEKLRGFSHDRWPKWASDIRQASGIDTGFVACGGYYLAETTGEAASMIGMRSYWDELDIECEAITKERLLSRQPWLAAWCDSSEWIRRQPDRAAWWVPGEYQVRPPRLLNALRLACEKRGVHLCFGEEVSDLSSLLKQFPNASIVCCGGGATGLMDDRLKLKQALIPVRGQMLLLRCESFDEPLVLNIGNRYLIARGDGMVLAGSCEEEVGFDASTTEDEIEKIRRFASRLSPALAAAPEVMRWAGLRPMTFDGFPMIGRVPEHERLYVAAGHYRSGIHFAPATAVAMADALEDRNTFMDMSAFSVGRQQGTTP